MTVTPKTLSRNRRSSGPMRITEDLVHHLAERSGLVIAPEHMPGVIGNLKVLEGQIMLLFARPLDPLVEPAPVYRP